VGGLEMFNDKGKLSLTEKRKKAKVREKMMASKIFQKKG
jgi:hypothetical protein